MTQNELERWNFLKVAPWVGKQFDTATPKILIVGHSTYIKEPHGLSDEAIRSWLHADTENVRNNTFTYKYWTNILSALRGSNESNETIRKEWDNYALVNYIQEIQSPGLNQATKNDYVKAREQFKKVIQELNPTHALFFTSAAFDDLREKEKASKADSFSMDSGGKKINVIRLSHPSWYFSWRRAHEKIKTFLSE